MEAPGNLVRLTSVSVGLVCSLCLPQLYRPSHLDEKSPQIPFSKEDSPSTGEGTFDLASSTHDTKALHSSPPPANQGSDEEVDADDDALWENPNRR